MTIDTVFNPPLPTDSPEVFATKAHDTMSKLNPFAAELNALTVEVNGEILAVDEARVAAIGLINSDVNAVDAARNTAVNTTIPGHVTAVSNARDTAINVSIPAAVALVDAAVAATAAGTATAARIAAEAARDGAYINADVYDSTSIALSIGVLAVLLDGGGPGNTNGTFALAFSGGGGTGAAGTYTVTGGLVVAADITNPGTGYTSPPAVTFPGAASPPTGTAVVGNRVALGQQFQVVSSDGLSYQRYRHDAGPVATPVGPPYPSNAYIDAYFPVGKNLHNPSDPDVALGFFPNHTTGNLQENAAFNSTGFIPVVAGQTYTFSQKHYVVWYTSAKVFIAGTSDANTNKTQTAPANAAFVRASSSLLAWAGFQVEVGSVQTAFELYGRFLGASLLKRRSVFMENMALGSVGRLQTDFLKTGKNLFNKATVVADQFLGHDGSTGSSTTLSYSDFISVTPGQQYRSNSVMRFTTFYSQDKIFMSGGSSLDTQSITVPAGVAFVRVTMSSAKLDVFQLEAGSTSTIFEPHGLVVIGPNGEKLILEKISTEDLETGAVTPEKTNFFQRGKNLFNKATVTSGFISPSLGTITASATLDTSDFIAVTPSTTYYGRGVAAGTRFVAYYDANKTLIPDANNAAVNSFTTLAGAYFVRVSMTHSDLVTYQLELGSVATVYQPYGYVLKLASGEVITVDGGSSTSSNLWNEKTWATLGDSITAQNTWQPLVSARLGFTASNFGVGGTRVSGAAGSTTAMCQDARIDAIPVDRDLVTVMGGTNDWAGDVPLGAVDSTDPLTFHGALNTMLSKLMARFPVKRLALCTTPYGELPSRVTAGTWATAHTNLQGLTTRDYAEAIRVQCQRWGVPCIDVSAGAGWNTSNIVNYMTDDGGLLHPNTAGSRRIAEVVIGALKALEPLV